MKTKKIFYVAGIVSAAIVITSTNVTATEALGPFGKYGNLKGDVEIINGEPVIVLDCKYSFKNNCIRADW